jgi:hypothetical protein
MRTLKLLALLSLGMLIAPHAQAAEIGIGIGIGPGYVGPAPVCAYGYYPYYPYACAPYGYYGPEWFSGGLFIGAGPWFHGFHGRPGFYAGRGFAPAPAIRDRGNYGRIPAIGAHPAYRGDFNRGNTGVPANRGGSFRGGNSFHGGNSGGGFHGGGGRR